MNKTEGACNQHPEGCPEGSHFTSNLLSQLRDCLEWRDGPLAPNRRVQVRAGRGDDFWEALRLFFSSSPDETKPYHVMNLEAALGQWLHDFGSTNELSQRTRILLGIPHPSAQETKPDPIVRCLCGWQGKVSELVKLDQRHKCPACMVEFRPIDPLIRLPENGKGDEI